MTGDRGTKGKGAQAFVTSVTQIQRRPAYNTHTTAFLLSKKEPAVRAQLRRGTLPGHKGEDGQWYVAHETIAARLGVGAVWN